MPPRLDRGSPGANRTPIRLGDKMGDGSAAHSSISRAKAAPQKQRPPHTPRTGAPHRASPKRAGGTPATAPGGQGSRHGYYLSEHLAAAVALPRRGVGYNPGDLGGGMGVLMRLLLRLLPPGLTASCSAQSCLAALGAATARRVRDRPQQLHHRASPAPSCLPARPPYPAAPLPTRSQH